MWLHKHTIGIRQTTFYCCCFLRFLKYWPQNNENLSVLCPDSVLVYNFWKGALFLSLSCHFFFSPLKLNEFWSQNYCCLFTLRQRATKILYATSRQLPQNTWNLACIHLFIHLFFSHWQQRIFGPIQMNGILVSNAYSSKLLLFTKFHFIARTNSPNTRVHPSWAVLVCFCTAKQSHSHLLTEIYL